VRRRRIAGESGPAAPPRATPPPAKRAVGRRGAKKAAPAETPEPAVARTAPVAKPAAAPVAKPAAKPAAKTGTKPMSKPVAKAAAKPSAEPDAQPADERVRRPRPSRRDLLWLVPATLITLASLALGAFLVVNPPGDDVAGLDASRRQASSAAASAAETIFTFRYDNLDKHLTASKALMTRGFAKEFDKIAPALTELAPQRNIVVEAVARESAALPCGDECSPTKAEVLVFVDQARLVGDSTEPTVFANRIKVTMVKNDDGWLVSDVRAL
jgi:Mce-associated membrane protein